MMLSKNKKTVVLLLAAFTLPHVLLIFSFYYDVQGEVFSLSLFDILGKTIEAVPEFTGSTILRFSLFFAPFLLPGLLPIGRLPWSSLLRKALAFCALCLLFIPTSIWLALSFACAERNQCL